MISPALPATLALIALVAPQAARGLITVPFVTATRAVPAQVAAPQDALPKTFDDSPVDAAEAQKPLPDDSVASLDGQLVSFDAFHQYVGSVTARQPESDAALRQLVLEAYMDARAAELDVTVAPGAVQKLWDDLEARARAASGGTQGLIDSIGGEEQLPRLERALNLAALQREIVAAEAGITTDDVSEQRLAAWIAQTVEAAPISETPLTSPTAATWPGGEISRIALGRRLADELPADQLQGLLTELLGILAIEERATREGVAFTSEAAAEELVERKRLVENNPRAVGVSYEAIVREIDKRSLEELVATPKFRAEVLLKLLVAQEWDDARLTDLFERERASFEERAGRSVTFEEAKASVQAVVRQRSYQSLLASSSIQRRF